MTSRLRPIKATSRLSTLPFLPVASALQPGRFALVVARLGPTIRLETAPLPPPSAHERSGLLAQGTWQATWALSWPLVLTMILSILNGLVDTWVAGSLSPTAQATVGLTLQLVLMLNAITAAISIGCQVFVARFVGAGQWEKAAKAAQQSILCTVWLTVAVMALVMLGAPALYAMMGASDAVCQEGALYLRVLMVGLLPMNLGVLLNGIFKARGTTVAKLLNNSVESAVWFTGSLALGLWGGMGLTGLAAAFVLGKLAGVLMAWRTFRRMAIYRHIQGPWRADLVCMRRMLRVGVPTGLQNVLRNMVRMAIYAILALMALPTDAMAAYAIGFRLESLAYLLVLALHLSAATLVGQSLGAGRPDRAAQVGVQITVLAVAVASAFGAIFILAADPLASVFTTDPLVWAYTIDLLKVLGLSLPFLALGVVLTGVLQGAGETGPPMLFTLGSQLGVGLPCAYWLSGPMGWGPTGVWWAIAAGLVVQALLVTWWFRRGTWLEKVV